MTTRTECTTPISADHEHFASRADVALVFQGATEPNKLTPEPSHDRWEGSLSNIDRFLVYFAQTLLSDAHIYNAAGGRRLAGTMERSVVPIGSGLR